MNSAISIYGARVWEELVSVLRGCNLLLRCTKERTTQKKQMYQKKLAIWDHEVKVAITNK